MPLCRHAIGSRRHLGDVGPANRNTGTRPMIVQCDRKLAINGRFFEAPRWHEGRWWVSDMTARSVLSIAPIGEPRREFQTEDRPSGLGWMPDGALIVVAMDTLPAAPPARRVGSDLLRRSFADLSGCHGTLERSRDRSEQQHLRRLRSRFRRLWVLLGIRGDHSSRSARSIQHRGKRAALSQRHGRDRRRRPVRRHRNRHSAPDGFHDRASRRTCRSLGLGPG